MAKTDRLEMRLDDELRRKVDDLARAKGVSASAVVRRAVLDAHRAVFPDAARVAVPSVPMEVAAVTPAPCTVLELHEKLWHRPPTDIQRKLYDARARGYAVGVSAEHVEAVITTLFQIAPLRPDNVPFVVAPPPVHDEIEARVRAAYDNVKGTGAAPGVARTIRAMRIGLPSPWPSKSPRVWVAIRVGVAKDTPGWLTSKLMTVENTQANGEEPDHE
jgi:hypothetical protein